MARWAIVFLLAWSVAAWPQSSSSSTPDSSQKNPVQDSSASKPTKKVPDLSPPRSDRVNADDLGGGIGQSSSKDTQIDLSPPENDARAHPQSKDALLEAEASANGVTEVHSWDPHKAAKSVEVGDFYFKRKNYRAAEDRYREALVFKDNDAIAMFKLAICLEKLNQPAEAQARYEGYLQILPHGPEAEEAQKSIDRLRAAQK